MSSFLFQLWINVTVCLFWGLTVGAQPAKVEKDSLLKRLLVEKVDSQKIKIYTNLGLKYLDEDQLDSSFYYFNKAISLGQDKNYLALLADAHTKCGRLHSRLSDYPQMLKEVLKAEEYYAKIGDKVNQGLVLENIGGVYYHTREFDEALKYNAKAYQIAVSISDTAAMASSMLNQGLCYSNLDRHEEAINSYRAAEQLLYTLGEPNNLINVYMGYNDSYRDLKNYDKALEYIQKAYDLSVKKGIKILEIYAQAFMLETYLDAQQLVKAKEMVDLLLPVTENLNALELKKEIYEIIIRYCEMAEEDEMGFQYAQLVIEYTDSLYQEEKEKEKKHLETILALKEEEGETRRLTLEKNKQREVIFQQRMTVFISLSALLLILWLFYRQYSTNGKLRKAKHLLEEQKEEIFSKNQELKSLNDTKDQLFSIISHDLMSPVATLTSILTLLKIGGIDEEELPQFLDSAINEVEHTKEFLHNLLYWAKAQMDGITAEPATTSLQALAQQTTQLVEAQAGKKQIQLINEIPAEFTAHIDKDMIDLVFRNLVSNALKFTPQGGEIQISATQQANMYRVAVRDNGQGIPLAVQDKILSEELYTSRGTNNEKGTGMGLSLCKEFVEKNGGELWFESEEGAGTTFYFTVPEN